MSVCGENSIIGELFMLVGGRFSSDYKGTGQKNLLKPLFLQMNMTDKSLLLGKCHLRNQKMNKILLRLSYSLSFT